MQSQTPVATAWPGGSPAAVELDATRVGLIWAEQEARSINVTWLRDNCPCDECRIAHIGEHRYFLGEHEELPSTTAVDLVDGALVIGWSDGHRSTYAPADFARITDIASRAHPQPEPWSDTFEPERFDHDAVVAESEVRIAFLRATIRDGMTLVTGVPTESGECIRFLDRIGVPIRETPFDRLHDVYFHAGGYNVAHTDEPLPPHNDFASYAWPPSGQLIHMLVNDVDGGDWVNLDGFRVVEQVRQHHPEAVETLARVPVGFREHSDKAESWTSSPLVRFDGYGNVVGLRFSNQLMQPLDPCNPELEAWYEAYHLLSRAVNDPRNQISLRGHAGTMQVLHGHRILHARRGYDGTSGSRHLQDTYFEFDDLRAIYAVATGEAR